MHALESSFNETDRDFRKVLKSILFAASTKKDDDDDDDDDAENAACAETQRICGESFCAVVRSPFAGLPGAALLHAHLGGPTGPTCTSGRAPRILSMCVSAVVSARARAVQPPTRS